MLPGPGLGPSESVTPIDTLWASEQSVENIVTLKGTLSCGPQFKTIADQARRPMYLRPGSPLFRLLDRMLDYNPMRRITAEEALQHEYWQQEPAPGPNCFAPPGKPPICTYPKRSRTPVVASELAGGKPAAGGAQQQQAAFQQQQAQQQQAPAAQQHKGGGSNRKRKSDGHR